MSSVALFKEQKSTALKAIGFGLFMAWFFVTGFNVSFSDALVDTENIMRSRGLVFHATAMLVFVVAAGIPGLFDTLRKPSLILMPIFASAGTGLFALSPAQFFIDPNLMAGAGLVAMGVAAAWYQLAWADALVAIDDTKLRVWAIAGGYGLVGFLFVLITKVFDATWSTIFAAAIPLLSAIILALTYTNRGEVLSQGTLIPQARVVLIVQMIALAVCEIVWRRFAPGGLWGGVYAFPEVGVDQNVLVGCVIGLAIFVVAIYVGMMLQATRRVDKRYLIAMVMAIGGFLALSLFASNSSEMSSSWFGITWAMEMFMHVLFQCVLLDTARELRVPALRVFGIGFGVKYLVGLLLLLFTGTQELPSVFLLASAYLLIIIVALLPSWLMKLKGGVGARAKVDEIDIVCSSLIQEYGLTTRESEILRLIVAGDSIRSIGNTLDIAEGTVKTHVNNLYRKLEIHSRQELYSLVYEVSRE